MLTAGEQSNILTYKKQGPDVALGNIYGVVTERLKVAVCRVQDRLKGVRLSGAQH